MFFRVLIIEDDQSRVDRLKEWLPEDIRIVVASSAGRAMGLLERDRGRVYAGIMLDHDLQLNIASDSDRLLSGSNLIESIIKNISKDVPILVHSMNAVCAADMVSRLERAGFQVDSIPMNLLSKEQLLSWIEDARSVWESCS
ncbi:MAG: cyclic-phosphate processing receiver domain-containing protein [Syntrophales bacterium]